MPRSARVGLQNYPHHIVQRGHNRQTVFHDDREKRLYLRNLQEGKLELGCRVYAYCLMPNHVHLVVDPGKEAKSLGELMKRVAARQTRYVNRRQGRRGTLWEGRYRSSVIDTDRYLLACCRYVERNPVRAGMVARPEDHAWSSYRHKAGLVRLDWLDEDPYYRSLGRCPESRRRRYRRWMEKDLPKEEVALIRKALQRGQLTGRSSFIAEVQHLTGHLVASRGQGRPRKNKSVPFLT